jgi:catechol 2,3-dioxygenase-like lactoylglutathione lyase family enzyme
MASVRYIVDDVDKCVDFYRGRLGFSVEKHNPGKFAQLVADDLHLFLNAPGAGGAGKAGGDPRPGGWNRLILITKDLEPFVEKLRSAGSVFRGEITAGGGGRQILVEDPSGNVVELFEYAKGST